MKFENITISNNEAKDIYEYLSSLENQNENFNKYFSYFVNTTKDVLETRMKSIDETIKEKRPDVDLKDYFEEINLIAEKYAKKDNNGKIIWKDKNKFVFEIENSEDYETVNNKINKIQEKYKDKLNQINNFENEMNDIMNIEKNEELLIIDFNYIPDNISPKNLKIIKKLVKFEKEEE